MNNQRIWSSVQYSHYNFNTFTLKTTVYEVIIIFCSKWRRYGVISTNNTSRMKTRAKLVIKLRYLRKYRKEIMTRIWKSPLDPLVISTSKRAASWDNLTLWSTFERCVCGTQSWSIISMSFRRILSMMQLQQMVHPFNILATLAIITQIRFLGN